jgi:uncharacterized membrane protein YdbT with pleckstrin-like domain
MNLKDLDELIPHPSHEAQMFCRVFLAVVMLVLAVVGIVAWPPILWVIVPILVTLLVWGAFRKAWG